MSLFARRWNSYWQHQTLPLHKTDDDDYYVPYSAELRFLYGGSPPERVLEIGCGNGALFHHLGFDRAAEYKGVDYSGSMLQEFRKQYPGTTLITASGHDYEDDGRYDLIFSNAVAQYFDRQMLGLHLEHMARMLAPSGVGVCASVPWRCFRGRYAKGEFFGRRSGSVVGALRHLRFLANDTMGSWFEWREFEELGQQHGLVAKFYGSLHYPYRFHAVFRHAKPAPSVSQAA